jgi:hypothetical protein
MSHYATAVANIKKIPEAHNLALGKILLTSAGPNRQTLRFPSAKSRSRLHPAQKCCVMDVMNDTVPLKPGT